MVAFRYFSVFIFIVLIFSVAHPAYSQENDLDKAKALNQQATNLYRQGRYQEAIIVAKKALAIKEKALGCEHHSVATSLNNLAMLYNDLGDYAKAEPLYKRALVIYEKALGHEHPGPT